MIQFKGEDHICEKCGRNRTNRGMAIQAIRQLQKVAGRTTIYQNPGGTGIYKYGTADLIVQISGECDPCDADTVNAKTKEIRESNP